MSFENYDGTALDIESLTAEIQPEDEPNEDTQTDEPVDETVDGISEGDESDSGDSTVDEPTLRDRKSVV